MSYQAERDDVPVGEDPGVTAGIEVMWTIPQRAGFDGPPLGRADGRMVGPNFEGRWLVVRPGALPIGRKLTDIENSQPFAFTEKRPMCCKKATKSRAMAQRKEKGLDLGP